MDVLSDYQVAALGFLQVHGVFQGADGNSGLLVRGGLGRDPLQP
jgi:hypothetical protein